MIETGVKFTCLVGSGLIAGLCERKDGGIFIVVVMVYSCLQKQQGRSNQTRQQIN